jgi:hypothetical protein
MQSRRDEIVPGSVWRQVTLGTEAVYTALAANGDHVDVEVRSAPGLRPGTTLRLTTAAVTRVADVDGPPRRPHSI